MKDLTKMVLLFSIIFLIWIVKIFAQESSMPDYTNEQYYLMEPPMGMNAQYAWQFPDGKGDGITIVDIEFGWNWDHIDLRNNASANVGSNDNADHGTSVMGILAAEENGFGITGFVPHAQVYGIAQNFNDRDITSALDDAVSYLDQHGHPGDIILIELQVNGSYQQQNYDLMPVEFLPLGYSGINNRQAIIDAINEGYVVVEVAGNGSHNLDGILPAYYTHAIMVAGANINNGYIGGNSNYGERIDANGWAYDIITCGLGDKYQGSGPDEYYTDTFGETSGAGAMVAGATAILQAINKHYKEDYLRSYQIQDLYRYQEWGYPPNFGNRPDLKKLIRDLEFLVEMPVDQVDENDSTLGSDNKIYRYINDSWQESPVPTTWPLYYADHLPVKANQGLIERSNPTRFIKYHHWNNSDANIINYIDFEIIPALTEIKAHFEPVKEATLMVNLIVGGESAQIGIKDPWLLEEVGLGSALRNKGMEADFKYYDSPKTLSFESDHKGVFLDQDPQETPIYYSVNAPTQPITLNGKVITFDLESWSASGADITYITNSTTPVIFRNSNPSVTANMKGRRLSNVDTATAGNNGSKLAYHFSYTHWLFLPYLIYEDRGNIYEVHQGSPGVWSKDTRIAAASGNIEHHSPAVTYLDEMYSPGAYYNKRMIVWDKHNLSTQKHLLGCNFITGYPIEEYEINYNPHPSAAGYYLHNLGEGDDRISAVAAFRGGNLFESIPFDGIRLYFLRNPEIIYVNNEPSADYPTIDNRKYRSTIDWKEPHYMLAWQEENGIHYDEFERDKDKKNTIQFQGETLLNAGCTYLTDHVKPSLQTFGKFDDPRERERVYVAWQATDGDCGDCHGGGFPVICFREKTTSGWQSLQVLSGVQVGQNPSVTGWYNGGSADAGIAYESFEGMIGYLNRSGGEWSEPSYLAYDAANPAANTIDGSPSVIWTESTSPHRIMFTNPETENKGGGESIPHSRRLSFNLVKNLTGAQSLSMDADITLVMAEPEIISSTSVQRLSFQFRDSLLTPVNAFQTLPVSILQPNTFLRVPVRIFVQNLKRKSTSGGTDDILPIWQIQLKNSVNNQTLTTLYSYQITQLTATSLNDFMITDTFEIALNNYLGNQIQIAGITFLNKGTAEVALAEVYDFSKASHRNNELTSLETNSVMPLSFNLFQNYPNPFNPTTTFTFDLPKLSNVNLIIYDITGRKICTLISSTYPAGSHQIQWDGTDDHGNALASGIYVYRIEAGKYVQSRKMMLLK